MGNPQGRKTDFFDGDVWGAFDGKSIESPGIREPMTAASATLSPEKLVVDLPFPHSSDLHSFDPHFGEGLPHRKVRRMEVRRISQSGASWFSARPKNFVVRPIGEFTHAALVFSGPAAQL